MSPDPEEAPLTDDDYIRDIEESDAQLDADEDPVGFWEQKQRDLVTSVLDYNLGTLSDLITDKTIDLSPEYQRRDRWSAHRQSKLIESFLMNVPIPPIFLNEDSYGVYSVIDGKQRLTGIYEFMRGRLKLTGLKVFSDINGRTVDDLPPTLQSIIRTRANLRAVIILRQSDPDIKFEVFQRLNTGGVRANPQEIRNSTWPGPFNNLVLELSQSPQFHRLLHIAVKNRSAIYKEMRDAEFVLRYFTFRETWSTFAGGMMRHMDTFMADHQRMDGQALDEAQADFAQTLACVEAAFGDHSFQRWVPSTSSWRQQVIAALYDAEMFACRGRAPDVLASHSEEILDGMQQLFADEDFRKSIDAATNTPGLFRARIEMVKALIDSVAGA
jgi:hypothetical protein